MKPFLNIRQDFMYLVPTIGLGFPIEGTQWVSLLWLGLEAGITWESKE